MSRLVNSARCKAYMLAWVAAEKWVTDSVAMWGSCWLASICGCVRLTIRNFEGCSQNHPRPFLDAIQRCFRSCSTRIMQLCQILRTLFPFESKHFWVKKSKQDYGEACFDRAGLESKDCLKIMYCHQGRSLFLLATQSQWLIFPWQKRVMNHDQSML